MEAGTLQLVVHVLRDGNTAGRAAAARALRNIVTHHPPAKAAAVDCGAVSLLLDLLDTTQGAPRLTAITALGGIAAKNDRIHACIALEGAVGSLVAALGDPHASVSEAAATTLAALCTTSEARHALAAAGGVDALAAMLRLRVGQGTEGQLQGARVAAAQAIRVLVSCEMHAIKQVRCGGDALFDTVYALALFMHLVFSCTLCIFMPFMCCFSCTHASHFMHHPPCNYNFQHGSISPPRLWQPVEQ